MPDNIPAQEPNLAPVFLGGEFWDHNGWHGYVIEAEGLPPMFRLKCQSKGRWIDVTLSAEALDAFDPDEYWNRPANTVKGRAIGRGPK